DRDPKHTANIVENWFVENKVEKLDWVAQSPDLNPIEHVWSMMGKKMKSHHPSNKDELWDILQQEWYTISPEVCKKLARSMMARVKAVIKQSGGSTK
ncbi:unnamed protein product, partial [Rotaria sp. Silwood1]